MLCWGQGMLEDLKQWGSFRKIVPVRGVPRSEAGCTENQGAEDVVSESCLLHCGVHRFWNC